MIDTCLFYLYLGLCCVQISAKKKIVKKASHVVFLYADRKKKFLFEFRSCNWFFVFLFFKRKKKER